MGRTKSTLILGTGGWLAAKGKTTLPQHEWAHLAGSFDGSNITVHVNGQLDGTRIIDAAHMPSPFPLRIGHATYSPTSTANSSAVSTM